MKNPYIWVGVLVIVALGVLFVYGPNGSGVGTTPTVEQSTEMEGEMTADENLDEACDAALAYMTFESGEEADAFLAECKAGKRPEVLGAFKG